MNINLEFANPVEWNIENDYSINDVVFDGSEAFTALDYVPAGTLLTNETYWKKTGKYIRTLNIADGAVTTQKLAENAITKEILPDVISSSANGESVTAADASYLASLTVDGKAVQDGTPTPSNPVDVQVVKSPNLLDTINAFSKETTTYAGCTITNNNDGTFTLSGTNTQDTTWGFNSTGGSLVLKPGTYKLLGGESLSGCFITVAIDGNQMYGTFTLTEEKTLTQWRVVVNASATISGTCCPTLVNVSTGVAIPFSSIGLKVGDTVTPINLQGNVLASLPDGTKDVLTVDSVGHCVLEKRVNFKVFDGTENWTAYNFDHGAGFYSSNAISDMLATGSGMVNKAICSAFIINGGNVSMYDGGMYFDSSKRPSCIYSAYTVAADFKTWLASNHVYLYYACTPQTIDLGYIDMPAVPDGAQISVTAAVTPTIAAKWWVERASSIPEALQSLRNDLMTRFENEITTLASSVAPVENDIASENYNIGNYLVKDNVLYIVTSAIASGESIIPGTNVTATTVMAEILTLTS